MKYYGKIKEKRDMTNYEWIMKNWDKKIDDIYNTVGKLVTFGSLCSFITRKYCDIKGSCTQCVYTWLHAEATKGNNLYFNDVQED